jgi:hypothetical protein
MLLILFAKYGTGYILGDFFTNAPGHPEVDSEMIGS